MEELLKQLYYKEGYNAPLAIYRELKTRRKGMTLPKIRTWLKKQESYQLHIATKAPKSYKRIMAYDMFDLWQVDLMFMFTTEDISKEDFSHKVRLPTWNRNHAYILTCINVFSKMGYARPLRSKREAEVAKAMEQIIQEAGYSPHRVESDGGSEFTNKTFKKLMERYSILHHINDAGNHRQNSIIERFNRSLRDRIYQFFTKYNTFVWIDQLQDIIDQYNNTFHETIQMKPNEVSPENQDIIFEHVFAEHKTQEPKTASYNVGDRVRVKRAKERFGAKGAEVTFSRKIYVVEDVSDGRVRLEGSTKAYQPRHLKLVEGEETNPYDREVTTEDLPKLMKKIREKKTKYLIPEMTALEERKLTKPRIRKAPTRYR